MKHYVITTHQSNRQTVLQASHYEELMLHHDLDFNNIAQIIEMDYADNWLPSNFINLTQKTDPDNLFLGSFNPCAPSVRVTPVLDRNKIYKHPRIQFKDAKDVILPNLQRFSVFKIKEFSLDYYIQSEADTLYTSTDYRKVFLFKMRSNTNVNVMKPITATDLNAAKMQLSKQTALEIEDCIVLLFDSMWHKPNEVPSALDSNFEYDFVGISFKNVADYHLNVINTHNFLTHIKEYAFICVIPRAKKSIILLDNESNI